MRQRPASAMEPADLGLGDSSLHRYLDGEFWSLKNELRGLLGGCPLFRPRYDLNLDEMRTLTFQRVTFTMGLPLLKRAIQDQVERTRKFVSRSLVIGEVLSTADMATGVKCGIIYWLFGGAVRNLGGPAHVTQWLQPLQEQKYTGMFAMTERGHGSNVRGIQTEATFDFSAQEFVINTPCKDAEKMYIGNAMYGNYAAVFAQLIINGRSQGPHCFIVPVRDEHGRLHPGVTVVDMMHKEGLHGVDNGILRFDNVRIPRENLLDKFGSVAPDGQYHSPIKDKSARFNAMLAALTPSRLAVTFQAMGSMKLGLTIAIRYSHSRRQFGPKAREEVKIIEHQTQTLRLMPHLATALALTFASRYAGTLLDEDIFRGKELVSSRPLQALVAGLKAYSTWENVSCLQDCRECTGGMGYMMENQISGLKCDTDVFVTFEGDNVVMLQVVVRELLAQYTKQYEERPVSSLLRNWAESGSDRLRTSFLAFNMDTVGNLTFLLKAVHFRERILQRGLVARIYYKVMTKKEDFFRAWNSCLHHITCLSLAHIHRVTLEQFCLAVRNCPDQEDQALLKKENRPTRALVLIRWLWPAPTEAQELCLAFGGCPLCILGSPHRGPFPQDHPPCQFCLLYGTKLVFQERAWYLEHKYLTPMTSMRIRRQLLHLCDSVKDDALRVISAFNISHASLHAPIAGLANPKAAWVLYPAPQHSLAGERARSPRPKLRAKL
ncbi:acyl-coenzyme A oxidase-like protein isoform X2 [Cervus canadensis]|uniref:acyl-coenzyme A oxidase-like protein isoform X2 n=1 Tax=Cervus canadensis TaxID=1574408 RepID=UPI001C9E5C42|nr:acyl-coenzyme A oxidase-like protein isoform X2 [Cervus canadensis]